MSVRGAHAILGTFVRAGILCLAAQSAACFLHGLPQAPDTFSWVQLSSEWATASLSGPVVSPAAVALRSWDGTTVQLYNANNASIALYVRVAVEQSVIQ